MNLYPYQETWIADDSRFIIGCWSRQIGKTYSTTLKIAMAMARAAAVARFEILSAQHKRYNISRANYDQTGIGEMPTEEAKRRFGEYRSEGVLFTAAEKLGMATRLKATMDDGRLRIPVDGALRADLHALRCVTGATGNARFIVDNDTDGHAGRTWALALACRAADAGEMIYDYRAVPKIKAFKNSLRNADENANADRLPVAAPKKRNLRGSASSFFHPPAQITLPKMFKRFSAQLNGLSPKNTRAIWRQIQKAPENGKKGGEIR